ncbi:hypothetical protein BCV70DRAFT_91843 [Testicularia cyperi]|uniref:C3H1-type domain-containing protein n=1 Tax=Testicularia cyperi TaxID=1882483 RepID=A0A317XSK7_9BASI|nr:hypothetical protein BCV70DRAFT_91843 [Testicularia cyperi]
MVLLHWLAVSRATQAFGVRSAKPSWSRCLVFHTNTAAAMPFCGCSCFAQGRGRCRSSCHFSHHQVAPSQRSFST